MAISSLVDIGRSGYQASAFAGAVFTIQSIGLSCLGAGILDCRMSRDVRPFPKSLNNNESMIYQNNQLW
jgi:hypothetical protein